MSNEQSPAIVCTTELGGEDLPNMSTHGPSSFSIAYKVFADGVMGAVALSTAFFLEALHGIALGDAAGPAVVTALGRSLVIQIPILVALVLTGFAIGDVYGRVRGMKASEKIVRLVGSATLVFTAFGLLQSLLPSGVAAPLGVWVGAWALEIMLLVGSRYWSTLWRSSAVKDAAFSAIDRAADARERVLVIGGAGYIGSALLPRLLDGGYRVRVLDLLLFGEGPIRSLMGHPDLELVRADVRQVDQVVLAMNDVDAVVHLAGLVGDPACSVDADLTTEVNLDFTRLIAEVAKGAGVSRFVFASSCSVYGASDEVLDETSELNPVSLYARSKIASENVLFEMASPTFVPTMLRFGTIYGLSGRSRFDLVVNLLSAKAVEQGKITVFGGDQWRPFVHVDDAARAILMVLDAPVERVRNEIFNVGSDEQNATLGDIGHLVNRLVPEAEYVDSGLDGDRRNYRVDFTKIREQLGFTPRWTLEAGIRQVIDAVRSGAVEDYTDAMYSNVRFLRDGMAPRFQRVRRDWAHQRIEGDVTRSAKSRADARSGPSATDRALQPQAATTQEVEATVPAAPQPGKASL